MTRLRYRQLLPAIAMLAGCQRVGGPDVQLQRMMVQPRYTAYGASAFFRDGKAMQLPPPGTVAREDSVGPAAQPTADPATLGLGRDQFHVVCAPCHGEGGFGGGMVARNLPGVAGLALQAPAVRALSPAQLYARLTRPGDVRHVRAAALSAGERWAVVLYTRELLSGGPRTDAARADSASAAEAQRLRRAMVSDLRRMNGAAP